MVRPVRVLHILHAFAHGGLENGIVNIINGSPPEIDHDLCVLTQRGEFLQRICRPVHCYELHRAAGSSMGIIARLARVIRQSGADIVHTRNWGAFDGVFAACLCPGVKLLHGEHGRDISDPQGLNRRRNRIRRLLSFRVAKFTAVSKELGSWLTGTVHIPSGKVVVIPNGVDTDRYCHRRDETLRGELGIGPDDFVVGTVGRLDPIKNHAGLIRAFSLVARTVPGARLVIVGDGPERAALETLVVSLKGMHVPILTGYRADVERLYGVFDVFVLNSFAEGMSNTLLEAMSSGLPILCTPVGAAVDLIRNGENGRHVLPGDDQGLARLITDYLSMKELRERHGSMCRKHIEEHYSLNSMISDYTRLYRDEGTTR
jgi:sugar transferase (PEP-CTERM/EpsH1 system associated)